jgi:hypothetical protein
MKFMYLLGVFGAGFASALNLAAIRYPESMPEHVTGEWWVVGLEIILAFYFGVSAISKRT